MPLLTLGPKYGLGVRCLRKPRKSRAQGAAREGGAALLYCGSFTMEIHAELLVPALPPIPDAKVT